jgi:RNA polymerase sigma-70 factor, ECF subfamily
MTTFESASDARIADAWREHRSYLLNLAFGMLGDIGSAEDAVQEAFVRLSDADVDAIDEPRGWLIVVTSRICLDQLGSARSRRERPHEIDTLEYAGRPLSGTPPVDPADRVTLDDEVNLALLVMLQRLKPAERVVFLLHDVFQLPFETIAQTVGRTAASCRQLAKRARDKVAADPVISLADVDAVHHRELADRFIAACADGDFDALVTLLDPSAWGEVDLGPHDRRTGSGATGRENVAANVLEYMTGTTMVSHPIAGDPVILAFARTRLFAVLVLTIDDDRIAKLHVIADPAKLSLVSSQLSDGVG